MGVTRVQRVSFTVVYRELDRLAGRVVGGFVNTYLKPALSVG